MSDWTSLGFPAPQVNGYGYDRDVGILRTPFETPTPRLKQGWKDKRETYKVWFLINADQLADAESFFADNAYDWFTMPLINGDAAGVADYTVRAAGPCTFSPLGMDWWKAQFTVETQIAVAAPDLTDPGYSLVEETCCLADDVQCCESEVDCVEWTQVLSIPPTSFGISQGCVQSLPAVGKVLALLSVYGEDSVQYAAKSTDGYTWEETEPPFTAGRSFVSGALRADDVVFVIGEPGAEDAYVAATDDGDTFYEYYVGGYNIYQVIESAVYAESRGEYWLFCRPSNVVSGKDKLWAWKTSDDPLSGTATWTRVAQSSMSFSGSSKVIRDRPSLDAVWVESLGKFFLAVATTTCGTTYWGTAFCDSDIYSSSDGLTWTAVNLPNGWRVHQPSFLWVGDKLLLLPALSATNNDDHAPEAAWVFGTTDGTTWTKVGELPDADSAQQGKYNPPPFYNPENGMIVIAPTDSHWYGWMAFSTDGGATWDRKVVRWYPVEGIYDDYTWEDAIYGAAYIPGTERIVFARDGDEETIPEENYWAVTFDAACITVDPPPYT